MNNDSNNDDKDKEQCKGCGRLFKRGRGLKIHHTRTGCLKTKVSQRTIHKSEAKVARDSNHSSDNSHVGLKETTKVSEEKIAISTSREQKQTADKEGKLMPEDEMELQVEEEVYQEVQNWIGTQEKQSSQEKRSNKESKKDMKNLRSKDIRSWLHTENTDNEAKDSRTVVARARKTSEEEKGVVDTRKVVGRPHKEERDSRTVVASDGKKSEGKNKAGKSHVDIRDWLEAERKPEKENSKRGKDKRWSQENDYGDTRRVVKEKSTASLINEGPDGEVLARHGLHLNRGDMKSLQGQNYLNDKIIDEYLRLVQQRNESHPDLPKVKACTTFLYTQLKTFGLTEGCKRTRRWIKEDLTKKDFILFPIHNHDHWSLVVVEIRGRVVHYLDSINGSRYNSSAPGMIRKYMEKLHERKGEEVRYKVRIRKDCPLQENGVDCGVFTCLYAERIVRKAGMNFKQADIAQARERMLEELLQGRLLQEEQTVKKKESERKKEESKPKPRKVENKKKSKAEDTDRKERIDWPKANSPEWENLDETLSELLGAQSSAPENKAVVHPAMIYALCKEKYGVKEVGERQKSKGPSKRQKKCTRLRKEINLLKKAYTEAAEEEKEAVKQLQEEKLKELRIAKRAESLRKKRKAYARNCNAFLSQPFEFARNQLDPKLSGKLESSKEEVENFLQEVHGKQEERQENSLDDIPEYEEPQVEYNSSLPSWHEFSRKLKKTRNKSAPGPNGVPYLLYKRCPKVARLLFGYLKGLWKKKAISKAWRKAEGIFIPKEEGATKVGKFRTISLLNVEGKLYFALKAERLTQYIVANRYIDESIQKGGIPGVSGCVEHTSLLSQLIREAKVERKNLVVTWLDIANAYGSIPHSLIMSALRKAHVPEEEVNLVESYYSNVQIRFSTKGVHHRVAEAGKRYC